VAGYSVAPEIVEPIRRYALGIGGRPEATLLVGGERLAAPVAALANATAIHSVDYDDTLMPAIAHFGAPTVASALALTQRGRASGKELIAAVVAGFEVGGKIGRAAMPSHYERWHSTASLGGLAAAGAAARGLKLDAQETDVAIGFAADDSGGTRYCIKVGDFSKSLHAGNAAWKGCQGALLAQLGVMGPTGHLEHPVGFFWSYTDERGAGRLTQEIKELGRRWEILDDDIKAHPCILASHTAIEGTMAIVSEEAVAPDNIEAITVTQPFYSDRHGQNYMPDSAMAARLSVPYCVSVAAIDGAVGLTQFETGRLDDPIVRRLMRRVTLHADRSLNERWPSIPASQVEIQTTGGEVFRREVIRPLGSHERPMSAAQHRTKVTDLLTRTFSDTVVERVLQTFDRLEHLNSVDELLEALALRETPA
jgi:2-methylcitrate dehydratase PrpD